MKFLAKQVHNIVLVLSVLVVYVCGILTIYSTSFIYPLLNGLILTIWLFLFKGKYRLIAITFCVPISALMSIKNSGFGSFLTWNIIIYLLILVFEYATKKQHLNSFKINLLFSYFILIIYTLIIQLCNHSSIPKFFSSAVYWALPILFVLDSKNNKKVWPILLAFSISLVISNLFGCCFVYLFPNQAVAFLTRYIPSAVSQYQQFGASAFRFPGFSGDPNHLGISVLLTSLILFAYSIKISKHLIYTIIMSAILSTFGILGGSKTFTICFVVILLYVIIYLIVKSNRKMLYTTIFASACLIGVVLVLNIDTLSKAVYRLFNINTSQGFLESLTTNRLSIWKEDISYLMEHPVYLLFGKGVWSPTIYGAAAHNFYIQIIWDIGLFGTVLFFSFIHYFFKNKSNNKFLFTGIIILVAVYAFGLHILYNETVLISVGIGYTIFSFVSNPSQANQTSQEKVADITKREAKQ